MKYWRSSINSSRLRLGIWMGLRLTTLNGLSSGPRFLLPFALGLAAGCSSKMFASASSKSSSPGTRYDVHDAPNAALQDLAVVAHILLGHHKGLDREVRKVRNVKVLVLVQVRAHLVDDRVHAVLTDLGLDGLRLIGAHVVLGEDAADARNTLGDGLVVIGGAVHAQQVLQHERGNVGTALHERREVLAHDLAAEALHDLGVKLVGLQRGDRVAFLSVFHVHAPYFARQYVPLYTPVRTHFHGGPKTTANGNASEQINAFNRQDVSIVNHIAAHLCCATKI